MRAAVSAARLALRALWLRILSQPHADKLLHGLGGMGCAALVWWLTGSAALGVIAAAVLGITKELYDLGRPQRHTADVLDAAAAVIGGLILWVLVDLVHSGAGLAVPLA